MDDVNNTLINYEVITIFTAIAAGVSLHAGLSTTIVGKTVFYGLASFFALGAIAIFTKLKYKLLKR